MCSLQPFMTFDSIYSRYLSLLQEAVHHETIIVTNLLLSSIRLQLQFSFSTTYLMHRICTDWPWLWRSPPAFHVYYLLLHCSSSSSPHASIRMSETRIGHSRDILLFAVCSVHSSRDDTFLVESHNVSFSLACLLSLECIVFAL